MKAVIKIGNDVRELSFTKGDLVKDLVIKAGHNPEAVLIIKQNTVVLENEVVQDNDEFELLPAVSGG